MHNSRFYRVLGAVLTIAILSVNLLGGLGSLAMSSYEYQFGYSHTFNFSDQSLYYDDDNKFSKEFANESGTGNVSNNGIVAYWADGAVAGMHLDARSLSDNVVCGTDISVKPNTTYTIVVRMRTRDSGKAISVNVRSASGTDLMTPIANETTTKYYYTETFTTGEENSVRLQISQAVGGRGVIYFLRIEESSDSLRNGTFETGNLEGWVRERANSAAVVVKKDSGENTNNVHSGRYAAKLIGYDEYSSYIQVRPNTNYTAYAWVKAENAKAYLNIRTINSGVTSSPGSTAPTVTDKSVDAGRGWQKIAVTFNTGEHQFLWVVMKVDEGGTAYFDDIYIQPDYTEIVDGSFESGMTGWKNIVTCNEDGTPKNTNPVQVSAQKAYDGNQSMYLDGGENGCETEYILSVLPNTYYFVTFYTYVVGSGGQIRVREMDDDGDDALQTVTYSGSGFWQPGLMILNTLDNTQIRLSIEQFAGGTAYVDKVNISTTNTEIDLPTCQITNTTSWKWNLKKSGRNLISDGDFESLPEDGVSWNTATFLKEGVLERTNSEKAAYEGEYGLHFHVQNSPKVQECILWLDLVPNTDYVFSTRIRGEYLSDTNKGDLTFGLIDQLTGKYLSDENTSISLRTVCYDDVWHPIGYEFNSGNQNKIGIRIAGQSASVYFDNMVLCLASDAEKVVWGDNSSTLAMVNSIEDKNGCLPDDNLIDCFDLDDPDTSFWTSGLGYGNFLSIQASTTDQAGNVLLVNSDTPSWTKYIKWIEVQPNTQYTLSVMVRSDREGESSFGIFDSAYSGYHTLVDIEQGESDGYWKNISFSFLSGKNNKIGLYFCDGGGQVAYNDLRLFESSKGFVMEVPTYGQIIGDNADNINPVNTGAADIVIPFAILTISSLCIMMTVRFKKKKS